MSLSTDTVLIGRVAGPVRTRYTARPWARRWARLAGSAFAADVRRGLDRALAVIGGLAVGYGLLLALRAVGVTPLLLRVGPGPVVIGVLTVAALILAAAVARRLTTTDTKDHQ